MALRSEQNRVPDRVPARRGADLPLRRLAFRAMATTCEVQYTAPQGDPQAARFEAAAQAWVHGFEAKYSRFQPGSVVSRINAAAGKAWVEVDAETEMMLSLCQTLHFMTRGLLDASALPLLLLWNWKADPPVIPTPGQIEAALKRVGWSKVQRQNGRVFLPEAGMGLDFGGFGKEYAVDLVALMALDHGLTDVLVDFGHDLRAQGAPPGKAAWHIGLEDPKQPGRTWASVGLTGQAIASSGDYLRRFEVNGRRFGHILDPRTGWPVANGCTQATVIAGTCLQAGMLSTAAFIGGLDLGLELIRACRGADGVILTDKEKGQTRGFHTYVATT